MLPRALRGKLTGAKIVVEFPAMGTTAAFTASATIGAAEVGFSLRTNDAAVAKARHAHAAAVVERTLAARQAGPVALTHKQAVALAGEVYRKSLTAHSDDPATPDVWAAVKGFT
jgi:hypothetical protein